MLEPKDARHARQARGQYNCTDLAMYCCRPNYSVLMVHPADHVPCMSVKGDYDQRKCASVGRQTSVVCGADRHAMMACVNS